MSQLCKRCPAQGKCEKYWEKKKECWDAKINNICPKKVCVRLGYCTSSDVSSMCHKLGPFKPACVHALSASASLFEKVQTHVAAVPAVEVSAELREKASKAV